MSDRQIERTEREKEREREGESKRERERRMVRERERGGGSEWQTSKEQQLTTMVTGKKPGRMMAACLKHFMTTIVSIMTTFMVTILPLLPTWQGQRSHHSLLVARADTLLPSCWCWGPLAPLVLAVLSAARQAPPGSKAKYTKYYT